MDVEVTEVAATDGRAAATPVSAAAKPPNAQRRLNALTASFQSALAAKAPQAPLMVILYNAVNEALQKQEYEDAANSLDQLEPLVRTAAKAALKDLALAFNARLRALMPLVLAARQSNPDRAAELSLGVNEANMLRRVRETIDIATAGDFGQANALLATVETLPRRPPLTPARRSPTVEPLPRAECIAGRRRPPDYPEDEEEHRSGNDAAPPTERNSYVQMDPADMPGILNA